MFIVIASSVEEIDHGPDVDPEELELLSRVETEIHEVVVCQDLVQVHAALRKAEGLSREWAIFESAKDGKMVRRAVVFEKDGTTIKRVE
jgi:hemolysin activation/secretion protein